MRWPQFSLTSLLVLFAAASLWIFLCVELPQNPGFVGGWKKYLITPLVLTGITVAVHRLLRDRANAWAFSALAAPIIALGSLLACLVLSMVG